MISVRIFGKFWRITAWGFIFVILLTSGACTFVEVGIERTPAPDHRLEQTMSAIRTANASLETLIAKPSSTPYRTPSPTEPDTSPTPLLTETPKPPGFSGLHFSTLPEGAPQQFFVAGTQRIYAVWDYSNMRTGLTYTRIWKKNGDIWVERASAWDMINYGQQGTIRDVSIYDLDTGLQPGKYSLTLQINGQTQSFTSGETAQESVDFWVVPSDITGPVSSPDKAYTAIVQWGGRLMIEDPDGNLRDMIGVGTDEIAQLTWFADSRHIAYTDRDRSKQASLDSDMGITHNLWVLDIITGERLKIGTQEENFHHPVVSPNGRYIAVLQGFTYQDGCLASPTLAIIQLDNEFKREKVLKTDNFTGLPDANSLVTIYPNTQNNPGYWKDPSTFVASLSWTCSDQTGVEGSYLLNIQKMEAINASK